MSRYIDAEPYEDCRIVLHKEDPGVKVKDIPTANVEEVRHGEWKRHGRLEGKIVMKCSVCGQGITSMFAPEYHYCPNCGAKMDENK